MSADVSDLPVPQVAGIGDETTELPMEVLNLHRDDRDVRLQFYLVGCILLLVAVLFVSIAGNVYQYLRRPDRIVVDRTAAGDKVVMVNDQPINAAVSWGPDSPGNEDKRRLANEWATSRYAIDPRARVQAIEKFLKMMHPVAAEKYVTYLKKQGEIERERAERWQAVWKPQLTIVDSANLYRLNLVGTQEVNKIVSGIPQSETRQIMFSLKLAPDKDSGRAAHNLHTGFLVLDILDLREVTGSSSSAGASALPQQP
jgi:hypothetical protein